MGQCRPWSHPPLPSDSDSDNVQGVQGDVPGPATALCGAPANVVIWVQILELTFPIVGKMFSQQLPVHITQYTLHITQYIARHTLHLTVTISLYTIRLKTQPQHPTHHLYWNITYYKVAVNCQPILKSQNQIMTHAMIIVYFPVLVPQAWPHWAPTVHPSRSDVRAAVWPYSGPWLVAVPRTAGT